MTVMITSSLFNVQFTCMILHNYSYSHDMKYLPWYSLSCYLLQDKDITPKEVALQKEEPFLFIIMEGTLDAPEE